MRTKAAQVVIELLRWAYDGARSLSLLSDSRRLHGKHNVIHNLWVTVCDNSARHDFKIARCRSDVEDSKPRELLVHKPV